MKKLLLITLIVLGVLILAGISLRFVKGPISRVGDEPLVGGGPSVGDKPSYVDSATCSEQARTVIEQEAFTLIHSCDTQPLNYGEEIAYLVNLEHGVGGDCPSGCFYARYAAIIFENGTVTEFRMALTHEQQLFSYIWQNLQLAIRDLESVSTKELVIYEGDYAFKYTFLEYLDGEVYVREGHDEVIGTLTPRGMTIEQAKELAMQRVRDEGHEIYDKGKIHGAPIPNINYATTDGCWNFLIITNTPQERIKDNYVSLWVDACLDGTTEVTKVK